MYTMYYIWIEYGSYYGPEGGWQEEANFNVSGIHVSYVNLYLSNQNLVHSLNYHSTYQVVTQTLCTRPDANMAKSRHPITVRQNEKAQEKFNKMLPVLKHI